MSSPSTGFAIPKPTLENLRCSVCTLFLSVSPVLSDSSSNQLVCNRCSDSCKSTATVVKVFEEIQSLVLRPCRYVKDDCPENSLNWERVEPHEHSCDYIPINCATSSITDCMWRGSPSKWHEHFLFAHPDMIISNDKIQVSLRKSYSQMFIQVIDTNIYIINVKGNELKTIIRFNVQKLIVDKSKDSDCEYEIEFKDPTSSQSMKIRNDITNCGTAEVAKHVNSKNLKIVLSVSDLACTIEIIKLSKVSKLENVDTEHISVFETAPELQTLVDCPLVNSSGCSWQGPLQEHVPHLKKYHKTAEWITTNQTIRHKLDLKTSYNILQGPAGLFRITLFQNEGTIEWKFHHIGLKSNELPLYDLQVKFLSHKSDRTLKSNFSRIRVNCHAVTDSFQKSIGMIMPFRLLGLSIENDYLSVKYYLIKNKYKHINIGAC